MTVLNLIKNYDPRRREYHANGGWFITRWGKSARWVIYHHHSYVCSVDTLNEARAVIEEATVSA